MTKPLPQTTPNPNNTLEHNVPETLVTLATPVTVPPLHGKAELEMTYTPDKNIMQPDHFTTWLDDLIRDVTFTTWEELAGTITDIFYDTLLPKHISLSLYIEGKVTHTIEMVKQQPQ